MKVQAPLLTFLHTDIEHFRDVLEFGAPIKGWVIETIVNHPITLDLRVDLHATDQFNTSDDPVFVTAVPAVDVLDFMGVILIQDTVVKH